MFSDLQINQVSLQNLSVILPLLFSYVSRNIISTWCFGIYCAFFDFLLNLFKT